MLNWFIFSLSPGDFTIKIRATSEEKARESCERIFVKSGARQFSRTMLELVSVLPGHVDPDNPKSPKGQE
jgi:hypothetical protein